MLAFRFLVHKTLKAQTHNSKNSVTVLVEPLREMFCFCAWLVLGAFVLTFWAIMLMIESCLLRFTKESVRWTKVREDFLWS